MTRPPLRLAGTIGALLVVACQLPRVTSDRGNFEICPFGWCEGQANGDTGSGTTLDTGSWGDGPTETQFLTRFSNLYCDMATGCWCSDTGECSGYGDTCRTTVKEVGDWCGGYDRSQAAICLESLQQMTECWELVEGDWISPCEAVFSNGDCNAWWYGPGDKGAK